MLPRLRAAAMALLVLVAAQTDLSAQQLSYGPGYGQPVYSPQLYGPQASTQRPYYPQTYSQPSYAQPANHSAPVYSQPPQPVAQGLNAQQLEQLVAPIALYPDTLIAQMLAAATYPGQVVEADRWRKAQPYASAEQIASSADVQQWDASVKGLTAFPQVLAEMDQNLGWTSALGNAYFNQPQDVLAAVQVMRQRAEAAGNLQSGPQESVSNDQGNISVAPTDPQMVYVPSYNPWTAYGDSVTPYPGFSLLSALGSVFDSSFGSSAVRFGLGIAMGAFSHMSWGWLGWGLNWLAQGIFFHQSDYFTQSRSVADWGLPYGGPRAYAGRGSMGNGFYRTASYSGVRGYSGVRTAAPIVRMPERTMPVNHSEYPFRGTGFSRTPQAYNRGFQMPNRTQAYGGSGYESGLRGRPGTAYGGSMQAYRAPAMSYGRGSFSNSFSNSSMSKKEMKSFEKAQRSGGSHFFGGGHAPKSIGGGMHFGGHSGGGGHSSGHGGGGGKHH